MSSNVPKLPTGAATSTNLQVDIQQSHPVSMNVSLRCESGEMVALVGPSGSGKSTVLRTIAGLHRAENSVIRCGDEVWEDTQQSHYIETQKRQIGLVFQDYALFPHLSALANVMLATPGETRAVRRNKAMALLDKCHMTGLEQRMPLTLSGGQKQRIALARALAREPQVLLLDEPFAAVDQQTRRKLYRELASLRRSLSLPIVLVTHDLTEVQLLADSLCLMHRGKTLQQGAVTAVINQPKTREIARLVGHQNLFYATVTGHNANHTLYRIGKLPAVAGPYRPALATGSEVSLLIAPSAIQMLRPLIPAQSATVSEHVIEFKGSVQEWVSLGDQMSIRLHLDSVPKSLRFNLPLLAASRAGVANGSKLTIGVPSHGIHIMPGQ